MAAAGGSFSDEEFWKACAELQQPAVAGKWELLLETSGISVYRLLEESTWLYKYKIFGVLKDCSPALLTEVFMDLGYRKQWDQYVHELYEKECDGETLVYWQVAYPFPMYNRDYVYIRQLRELDLEGRKIYVILAKSTSSSQFPERSGVIRVRQYHQSLAIESDGKGGSREWSSQLLERPGRSLPQVPQEKIRENWDPYACRLTSLRMPPPSDAQPSCPISAFSGQQALPDVWLPGLLPFPLLPAQAAASFYHRNGD
ncbi:phosphatidylcholine transfer protein isoform X3 [Ictidomys tridecemlineatus]